MIYRETQKVSGMIEMHRMSSGKYLMPSVSVHHLPTTTTNRRKRMLFFPERHPVILEDVLIVFTKSLIDPLLLWLHRAIHSLVRLQQIRTLIEYTRIQIIQSLVTRVNHSISHLNSLISGLEQQVEICLSSTRVRWRVTSRHSYKVHVHVYVFRTFSYCRDNS